MLGRLSVGMVKAKNEELIVIKMAKEFSCFIFKATQDAPKKFRFSLISKMQNLSLEMIGSLYKANDTFIDGRLLRDLDKSIEGTRKKKLKLKSKSVDTEHIENKLLTLQLTRATKFDSIIRERVNNQYKAMTFLKEIEHLSYIAKDMQCLTYKEYERIGEYVLDLRNLLGKWIISDRKRYKY